jgi:uncharacterized protein YbjQ (UPF0145 family)
MKLKEIAKRYDFHWTTEDEFKVWIKGSSYKWRETGFGSIEVLESNIDEVVEKFRHPISEERQNELAQAHAQLQEELAAILITSGFNFDGYTITKYSGYISGDDVTQIARGTAGQWNSGSATNTGSALTNALVALRRNALTELKQAAHALGCNAVIGVDFDYITLEPETANNQGGVTYLPYVFAVTANGNAVTIEKNR